ncbi:hypothetical protein PXJ20_31680 [Paraburkholderia sp. A1RI_3L]|uniref:hypothetical protein n=1 Tax=Paraburkholderia TaxID=1822464 RepID=UPI003B78C611
MNQPAIRPWRAKDFTVGSCVIQFMEDAVDRDFVRLIDELDRAVQAFTGAVRDGTTRDRQMATAREVVIVFGQLIKVSTPTTRGVSARPVQTRVIIEVARALKDCFVATLPSKDGHRFSDEIGMQALAFYRTHADHARTERGIWKLKFYDWARSRNLVEDPHYRWTDNERAVTFSRDELADFFRHYEARILQELLNCEREHYDGTNTRIRLPDPLRDDELRELIVAWTLQPTETKTINGHAPSGAAT